MLIFTFLNFQSNIPNEINESFNRKSVLTITQIKNGLIKKEKYRRAQTLRPKDMTRGLCKCFRILSYYYLKRIYVYRERAINNDIRLN